MPAKKNPLISTSAGSVTKLTPKKSERTRAAILSSAQEFLWTHPFREMTVAEIMTMTGTGRSAFYQYFNDLHDLMETLLQGVVEAILMVAEPWFSNKGNAIASLEQSLTGLVNVYYERGPIVRAMVEASTTDDRLEKAWSEVLLQFDDSICDLIEKHQAEGLIPEFDARPVAAALNRLDVALLIDAFGRHPRSKLEPVRKALIRIWISTLYQSTFTGDN